MDWIPFKKISARYNAKNSPTESHCTVFNNLDDIEQIASEIIFIEEGKLKFHRDISQLREEQNQYVVVRFHTSVSAISMKELT